MPVKNKSIRIVLILIILILNLFKAYSQKGVALVLCGGGAKGFAHIGVLKVIDSLKIPVDYVGGTSIGAIIGGLYAMGYSGKEIEEMAKQTDWETLFKDDANRNLIPFFEKNQSERYVASFKINEKGIKIPDGFISGQKILNFLSEITVKAHHLNDFRQFKIPFFCIATDIAEGKDIILENGFIATALRSSMSIPTAFTAFELNGKLLVDGGIINNFPVDVMKQKFDGTIIGVDIQKGLIESQKIESFTSILNQLSTILDLHRFNSNKSLCNIYIHPNIDGYSTMSFEAEAVDTLIRRGEESARLSLSELSVYSCPELFEHRLQTQDSNILHNSVFKIRNIIVTGQKRNSPNFVKQKLQIEENKPFTLEKLKYGIEKLYATNEYEYITYRFRQKDTLEIICKERIINSVGIGIHYEKGTSATVLLNYTHKNFLINGDIMAIDIKLSEFPGFKFNYVADKGPIPAPLLKFQFNQFNYNFYDSGNYFGNAKLNFGLAEIGFSTTGNNLFTIGLVGNVEYYDLFNIVSNSQIEQTSQSETKFFYNYKLFTIYDSRNSSVLPTKGNKFYANIKLNTDNFYSYNNSLPLLSLMYKNDRSFSINKKLTFSYFHGIRLFLSDSMPHPLIKSFLGGDNTPDLYEYQLPFYGLHFTEIVTKNILSTGLSFRYNIYKKSYVSVMSNVGASSDELILKGKTTYIIGGGINYTYMSILGPLQYTLTYSNISKSLISYFSLGYRF